MNKKICAITGGSGYVGGCIKNYFSAHGWEILELTRRPKPNFRAIKFQLGDSIPPVELADATAMVHCAYDFKPLRWKEIFEINVGGSRKILEAARAAKIPKIIFISSISAFDGCKSLYGKTKLEIEKIALANGALVVRPGLVYGNDSGLRRAEVSGGEIVPLNISLRSETESCPASSTQAGGMFGKLFSQIQNSSLIPMIGDGSQIQFLVHNEDLCAFAEKFASEKIELAPQIVTAANEQPWPFKQLLLEIARAHNKKIKFIPLPWRLAWLGLKLAEICGLKLNFRSDSLVSLMNQNPKPDFSGNIKAGVICRAFEIEKLKL